MSKSKEVMTQVLIEKARMSFIEIEEIVLMHREANRIPTLAASDIHSATTNLINLILQLNRIELKDAPKIDEDLP